MTTEHTELSALEQDINHKYDELDNQLQFAARLARELEGLRLLLKQRATTQPKRAAAKPKSKAAVAKKNMRRKAK